MATCLMPEPFTVDHSGEECWTCDQRGVWQCFACSLECMWKHRDSENQHQARACIRKEWRPPKFGERFAGPHAPLTRAVAQVGGIEVQRPFDLLTGDDFFTEEGRKTLAELCEDPWLYCEHWAPECRLFTRARGRPIRLKDGRTIRGLQPVRDSRHVMGFPHLGSEMKAQLRKSNAMALNEGLEAGPESGGDSGPKALDL